MPGIVILKKYFVSVGIEVFAISLNENVLILLFKRIQDEIKDIEDTLKLQKDIDRLGIWARKWGMRFQPLKCNMMQLTKKHNKIQASYTLEGTVLENVESIKYLGVTKYK